PAAPSHPPPGARPNLKRQLSTIPTPPQTQRKRVSRARPAGAGVNVGKLVFPGQPSHARQPARKRAKLGHPTADASTTLASSDDIELDDAPAHPVPEAPLPFSNPLVQRFKTPSPPSTPVRKSTRPPAPVHQEREENPFLVSPEEEARMLARRREREQSGESTGGFGFGSGEKTVTYVFRGVRQQFPNPLYNRPLSTQASQLPLAHPDYSPPPAAPPRLLFPPGQSKADTLAALERQAGKGKMRAWVGNVEFPQALGVGLGMGMGLEEGMQLDGEADEDMDGDVDGAAEVGRVVRMMPLVGRQGRENAPLAARRSIR
ncbi:hypothetical protein CALCODRAFT_484101, partial [Calocera cornea HHB12733]